MDTANSINPFVGMESIKDVLNIICHSLNPRDICRLTQVCRQMQTITDNIWNKTAMDTMANRLWVAKFYVKLTSNVVDLHSVMIDAMKMQAKQALQIAGIELELENHVLDEIIVKAMNNIRKPVVSIIEKASIEISAKEFTLPELKESAKLYCNPIIVSALKKSPSIMQSIAMTLSSGPLIEVFNKEFDIQFQAEMNRKNQ